MEITSAEFVISNTDVKKCPAGIFPEYAFIGRSNVGKSSLINMLTARKGLAMTSATPGKTMLINHFLINQELVSGRPSGIWIRPSRTERKRPDTYHNRRLYLGTGTDDKPLCLDRQPSGASEYRPRIYGMAGRERNTFFYHLHQSRQTQRRPPEDERQRLFA